MTDDQIYCKTPDGERALLQRTRLVQRNLRNVLILVDGATNVSELTRKLGDANFLRASLAELLRGGFIETLEESNVRRGIEAVNAPEGEPQTIPVPQPEPPSLPPQVDSVLPEHSNWRVEPQMGDLDEQAATGEGPGPSIEPAAAAEPRKPPFWQRWFARAPATPAVGDLAPEVEAPPRSEPAPQRKQPKVRIKPIRRASASEPRTPWATRLLLGLLGLFALAVVVAILFPYDRYREEAERRATAWLGQPVSIGSLRLALSGKPALVAENVRIVDADVNVGSLRALPSLPSMFGPVWKLATVVVDKPVVDAKAIAALLRARKAPPGEGIEVQRLKVEHGSVALAGVNVGEVSGDIDLSESAGIGEIRLAGADGALRLVAVPERGEAMKLTLSGSGWRVPGQGNLTADSVDAVGVLTRSALRLDKVEVRLLDGTVGGSGTVDWAQKVGVSLQGSYARIALSKLLPLVAPSARLQGEVGGKFTLRGSGETFEAALRDLSGGGPFAVERGVFENFDFAEAARSRNESPVRSGAARLETLEGTFAFDGSGWRLNGMRGNSGALTLSGRLSKTGEKLEGVVDVQLRGSANVVNVPVVVSGKLSEPVLLARRHGSAPGANAGNANGSGANDGSASAEPARVP